ncbi:penicillin-binding protein [Candidatus Saccharibacteria bacterium]|nr:penicillin-binding protein [Candidatus Saccharibacteria bacterium]
MSASKQPGKKRPPAKKKKKAAKKPDRQLSDKILASNYFSDRQKQNRKLNRRGLKIKPRRGGGFGWRLRQFFTGFKQRRAVRRDQKIRKQADYLSSLPETRFRRLLHNLHPLKILRFIFSVRGLILGVKIAVVMAVLGTAGLTVLYLYYRRDVPTSIANLQSCVEGQTTKYYDRTGETLLWASKSDFDCQPVQLEEVSHHLINALITTEDRDFYDHGGFEVEAILRATWNNLRNERTQGGSTITQQYIKNAILQDHSRTFERKIREIILAIELERTFEKDEILTAYLNTISFGSIYSGIEAASQGYFGKPAKDLSLDEAALLIAALPAPSIYWNDSETHVNRQHWVLGQMRNAGQISEEEYAAAIETDTLAKVKTSSEQYEGIQAPHFILEAERRLTAELCAIEQSEDPEANCDSIRLRGYKVITTLDVRTQALAERSVEEVIPTIAPLDFDNAAAVAVDVESGKVLALVGSRDFAYEGFGQNNTIAQLRDPGSAFKIFDYGALIENSSDWGPGSVFYDYETVFDNRDWVAVNFDERHAGPITMRRALGRSLNVPAVKAMYVAGMEEVHNFAYRTGIETPFPCHGGCGVASAIGAGSEIRLDELSNAYATFSRGGVHLPLTYVDQVYDSEGRLLRQWRQRPERVFRNETAYLVNHMLADEAARYTTAFNLDSGSDITMAVKTGTDDQYVNNWIVGYTKSVVFSTWMGYHDEAKLHEDNRLQTVAPKALMLKPFMEDYHKNIPLEKKNHWSRPAGIQEIEIDLVTGYQTTDESRDDERRPSRVDLFPSWYVPQIAPEAEREVTIDVVTGRLASDCTPERALRRGMGTRIKSEIEPDDPFYSNWQTPIFNGLLENLQIIGYTGAEDDLHDCGDEPPRIMIVSQPERCADICPIEIEAAAGTFDLRQINIIHNNQVVTDGAIETEGRSQRLTYNWRPLAVSSPAEVRGALTFEVVDEALYDARVNVFLDIDGFPDPVLPLADDIRLTALSVNRKDRTLAIGWNRLEYGLEIWFGGACEEQPAVYPGGDAAAILIDTANFPEGLCEAYIIDSNGRQSNRLQFQLGEEPTITPF